MKKSIFFLFTLIVIAAISCKKDTPVHPGDGLYPEKPIIEILSVSPGTITAEICGQQDERVIELSTGQSLELRFNIKARAGLSQYKIDIHSNFDCHSHRLGESAATVPWKVLDIVALSGQEITETQTLKVPENATAGNYHFMMQALDNEGYEAEYILYTLKVKKH